MPKDETIQASPTKTFFVEMLTRDIALDDAILDLLDNCVDGVLRVRRSKSKGRKKTRKKKAPPKTPYKGFFANLVLGPDEFSIVDNCGGIPADLARTYAFRMGRPDADKDADLETIGMYGIGMKRAVFKLGQATTIETSTGNDKYRVEISPDWLRDEQNWDLRLQRLNTVDKLPEKTGTRIVVTKLRQDVKAAFASTGSFIDDLKSKLATHYALIIQKGFRVTVNGGEIKPRSLTLLVPKKKGDTGAVAPYLFEGTVDGVKVSLSVGFSRPLLTDEEEEEERVVRRSSETAGWTVVCNDRVVVYCDKTRLTGWGEADVPGYHNQFIAISGVVHFRSDDASKLPVNTTKRGLEAGSQVYLFVKNYMREGTKIFTSFTNKWKSDLQRQKDLVDSGTKSVSVAEVGEQVPANSWKKVRRVPSAKKFVPKLPLPRVNRNLVFVRFQRPRSEVDVMAEEFFETTKVRPGDVGAAVWEWALEHVDEGDA